MSGSAAAIADRSNAGTTTSRSASFVAHALPFTPAAVGVLGAWVALLATSTPFAAVAAYTIYFAVAVILPGTLVYRRIAGFSESLLADVAWGSVAGLILELASWAVFTAIGANQFLWLSPALIVLAFIVVPGLRDRWRRPVGGTRTSPLAAWAITVGCLLGWASMAATYYPFNALPPTGGFFVDLPWHLGVAYEATRSVVPHTPEASAEGVLHYHWFGDAHFAAASLISRVDLPTVVIRTGMFPLVFVIVATTVALAIKITHRASVGAIAGLIAVSTTAGVEYWARLYKLDVVDPESPTGIYSVGVSCLVLAHLVDLVRGRPLSKARWVLFGVASFVAVGSKPSILLLFIPAVCIVIAFTVVRRRPLNPSLVAALAVMGAAFVASIFLFASPGGSGIAPSLVQVRMWMGIGTSPSDTSLTIMAVTSLVKGYLLFVVAAVALLHRRLRSDPAARLLGAVSLVGVAAAWLISHPGLSQLFFWDSAIPFAGILSAWGLVLAVDATADADATPNVGANRRRALVTFAIVCGAVLLGSMVTARYIVHGKHVRPGWEALLVAVLLIVLCARLLHVSSRTTFLVATVAAMLLSVPVTLIALPRQLAPRENTRVVAEVTAAQWVQAHTPLHDEVATNSHCLGPTVPHCDARSFWLSGFGGRRVLLEGFGVSPNALRRDLVDGYKAWRQPYHNQALLRLNDDAFTAPTAATLLRLYDRYDVRWLVADRDAGFVSPRLNKLARLEYHNAWIRVYKLDPALLGA